MSKKQTSEIHTLNKLARAISLAFSHILVEMQTGRGVKTRNLKLELSISTTIPERDKL